MATIVIIIYAVGYLICCVVMNRIWFKKFREYDVIGTGLVSIFWPFLLVFGLLGALGKLVAKRFEKGE